MKKRKTVYVRMPKEVEQFVNRVARLADTSSTNVYNVLLAVAIVHLDLRDRASTNRASGK